MISLELAGWRPGLNTVELIEAVRTCSFRTLSAAKHDVERFLDGAVITLEFDTEDTRELFERKLRNLALRFADLCRKGSNDDERIFRE